MRWRRRLCVCLMMAPALLVSAGEVTDVSVDSPWIREAPPGISVMAGYMTLRNNTSQSQVLVAASSSSFETLSMHRTVVRNGITSMVHTPQIEFASRAKLVFAPGAYHLMLMNPQRPLHVGDWVDIILEFRGGLRLPVSYEVRREQIGRRK